MGFKICDKHATSTRQKEHQITFLGQVKKEYIYRCIVLVEGVSAPISRICYQITGLNSLKLYNYHFLQIFVVAEDCLP